MATLNGFSHQRYGREAKSITLTTAPLDYDPAQVEP
eukprot:SAG31_NODE_20098_length_583_cov_20.884298_1_plen_35_part_01